MCICVCPSVSVSVSVCVRTLAATGHQFVTGSLKLALLRAAQRSTRLVHAYLSPRRRRTLLVLTQWRPLHVNTALIPSFSISFFIALSPTVDQRTQRSGLYFGVTINMGDGKTPSVHEELFLAQLAKLIIGQKGCCLSLRLHT